ncbi:acyl-CoA thioesterase [Aspergillus homomorphus CBS 101889]|uniref:Acyl-CoA thioesterase n=1 Tax=Aspergillus homomorphus (strain CBS 101889) TaxID=1450537 RepID=A0A395HIK8_ASPHC|nr:acyl-CoA thioesterase [Aspergillus homomorphus CBS 101889]RAL07647.1 acyl-CoA thioesterase [Aspergillus homomorphus CBS 101889]
MLQFLYQESPSSFAELMSLRRLDSPPKTEASPEHIERFQSLAPPYPPGETDRAFGGHVYAQSAYAAAQTVEKGFIIHDMTGTFILPGQLDTPYEYSVRHLRDGRSYSTRAVDARQNGQICFSGLCSFKRREEEPAGFVHQPIPAQERYASLLTGKVPEDFAVSPGVDADFYIEYWREQWEKHGLVEREFPGLEARKVDMRCYNETEEVRAQPDRYRQLTFYALKGMPGDDPEGFKGGGLERAEELRRREREGEFDNLYACAHMYAADKNSLLLIPRALGMRAWNALASLTLTVVFHEHGEALRMVDWGAGDAGEQKKRWFIQEGWTPRSGENRAIHESWLWSPEGRLVATSYQDSLLKAVRLDKEKL